MDKSTAQGLVRASFKASFEKKRFRDFLNEVMAALKLFYVSPAPPCAPWPPHGMARSK
jgi:hypothetical protein